MEYYSAIKRNEVLMHAITQTNSENIRLKEPRHKKPHIVCFYFCEIPSIGKPVKTERKLVVSGNWGEGECGGTD